MNAAQRSLDIYNEEMADDDIVDALAEAAKRGVAVRVVMTYATQWKSAFEKLKNAGVVVRTYKKTKTPSLYIHAKMIIADGDVPGRAEIFLGSENFSYTSLSRNRELGVLFSNDVIQASLEKVFLHDWETAKPF